ncbi:DUF6364 family protein [Rhodocaloribacter sp.]
MQTKLTLRLEEELIRKAKRYARARGKSVSQLVADHFRALTGTTEERLDTEELPPLTRSLLGAFEGEGGAPGNPEEAYRKHLEAKHR